MTGLYRLRCRFGAWLLREHVAAALEVNSAMRVSHAENATRVERLDYMAIGLKKAIGIPGGWRRFDDETARMVREIADIRAHAKDAL